MKNIGLAAAALLASTAIATAGGLDRSGQSTSAIFNDDGTMGISLGVVMPRVPGSDHDNGTLSTGTASYDVGDNYTQFGLSFTNDISDTLSYGLIIDQPYGANITYGGTGGNLTGTMADLSSQAVTMLLRYQFSERFSVFGGISVEGVQADVALNGTSYARSIAAGVVGQQLVDGYYGPSTEIPTKYLVGALALGFNDADAAVQGYMQAADPDPVNYATNYANLQTAYNDTVAGFGATGGYSFSMEEDYSLGYVIGAAYEIPDIALRFAVTYRPETDHSATTVESMFGTTVASAVNYVTPASLNVDFQTGIAADTLLTAGFRWTDFSAVDVVPTLLGSDLVNLDDAYRYSLGLARRFNENLAGSISIAYEPTGNGATVSPLGPTDGQLGLTIGGRYTEGNMSITGGINYTWLGDAFAGVADQPVAYFSDNHAIGLGLRAEFTF